VLGGERLDALGPVEIHSIKQRKVCHESRFWQVLVVVGVGDVEAAPEEAVGGALGDEGLQVGDPSTVVAGAVAELRGGA
jgi:hypothetical protein